MPGRFRFRRPAAAAAAALSAVLLAVPAQPSAAAEIPDAAAVAERAPEAPPPPPLRPVRTAAGRPTAAGPEALAADSADRSWHGAYPEAPSIPGLDSPLGRKYLAQYATAGGRKWLEAVARRGAPYLPYIRSAVAERGLPPELAYLPVIESAFLPTAVSRSGASGLWQFMTNSVGPFGIKVDDWTDERRDFMKSTDGALRKLEENYRYFGDWPLALAAYNAGLGAVKRAVDKAGVRDYRALCDGGYLKPETAHYVPKFLAAAATLSNAGRAGIDLGWPEDPAWAKVPVRRTVDLGLLARHADVPLERLRQGNPELRYGATPPRPGYELKVYAADAEEVAAALADPALQLARYHLHVIRSGDTLSALSKHFGVSVDMILQANPGLQPRYLKLGARLLVPAFKDVGPYERAAPAASTASFGGTYRVRKGDTLWSIALAHEVDPEVLAAANGMDLSAVLREGRDLKVPILKAEAP